MGKGSKRRKRQRNRKKTSKASIAAEAARPTRVSTASLSLPHLTLAIGHDGLFRGSPEATVIMGAFLTDVSSAPSSEASGHRRARTILRGLWRFQNPTAYPSDVLTLGEAKVTAQLFVSKPGRLVIVAVAIEEDSGDNVRDVFAAMESAARFEVWKSDDAIPQPHTIDELGAQYAEPVRVNLHLDHQDLAKQCEGDDFIGAQAVSLECNSRVKRDLRFHFRSADGRNDWTAVAHVRL